MNRPVRLRPEKRELALFAVCAAGFLTLNVLPLARVGVYAVSASGFDRTWAGMNNFRSVLANAYFRLAVRNTLRFTWLSVPGVLLYSLTLALMLQGGRGRMLVVLLLPGALPSAAISRVWYVFFPQIMSFSIWGVPVSPHEVSLHLLFLWKNLGLFTLLMLGGLSGLPVSALEAAALDGAKPLRLFLSVKLPLLLPTAVFAGIYGIVASMRVFREAFLLYGRYPANEIYMIQHYMNNHFDKLNYHTLSAAALLFLLPVTALIGFMVYVERRLGEGTW